MVTPGCGLPVRRFVGADGAEAKGGSAHAEGPWTQREERQAVRGTAEEGDEQAAGCCHLQLQGGVQPRREEIAQRRPLDHPEQGGREERPKRNRRPPRGARGPKNEKR